MVADLEPRIREITRELLDAVVRDGRDRYRPRSGDAAAGDHHRRDPRRRPGAPRRLQALVDGASSPARARTSRASASSARRSSSRPARTSQEVIERPPARAARRPHLARSCAERRGRGPTLLQPDDLMAFSLLLLVAGNETTTNLIGNAMLALLEHPDADAPPCSAEPVAAPEHGRGGAALRLAGAVPVPHDDAGQPSSAERRCRGQRHRPVLRLGQPRRAEVPGRRPVRRHPQHAGARRLRAGPALLPRRAARPARGEGRAGAGAPAHAGPGTQARPGRAAPGIRRSFGV